MKPRDACTPAHEVLALRRTHAAKAIGVCPSELRKWELAGFGPSFIRRGRVVLYPTEGLRAWVARNAIDPADGAA